MRAMSGFEVGIKSSSNLYEILFTKFVYRDTQLPLVWAGPKASYLGHLGHTIFI